MEKDYEIKFLGHGAFGCTICPPIKLSDELNNKIDFSIDNFSFNNINNCDYIGKILAVKKSKSRVNTDTYESELYNLLIIQDLDPKGKYTPQLIYANKHKSNNFLDKIRENETLSKCLIDKIKEENNYGYIILKNVGINLLKKYEIYHKDNPDFIFLLNCMDIILFLRKFIKLLYFFDKIYTKYIHLDIKGDNITESKKQEMFIIDFGRFQKININNVTDFITGLLKHHHYMASFEPKIYNYLLKYKRIIKKFTINELIDYIDNNFEELIFPYIIDIYGIKQIFQIIFYSDWEKQLLEGEIIIFRNKEYNISNIDDYIRFRQKEYFINYLLEKYQYNLSKKIDNINNFLYEMFLPIINKIDICCIGLTFAKIIIFNNYKTYKNCNSQFKQMFEKLIKDLLFNKFDDVKSFINDLEYLITYESLKILINKRFS